MASKLSYSSRAGGGFCVGKDYMDAPKPTDDFDEVGRPNELLGQRKQPPSSLDQNCREIYGEGSK